MKVLILNETARPSRYWEAALPRLSRAGIDVSLASVHAEGEIHRSLVKHDIASAGLGGKTSRDYPAVIYRLRKLIRSSNIDIVHASEAIPAALAGVARLSMPATKCIFHYHHADQTGAQKSISRMGCKLSNMVMAVSEASRKAAIENDGTPADKTFVAYNGIEPMRDVSELEIGELRRRLEIPANARIVTVVGGLREIKGHRTLFEACDLVVAKIDEALHLLVVGDGPEMDRLVNESERLGTFKTHFVGHQEDVAWWFSAADVVAVPSYTESFGLAAVEAMDLGRAVIASDIEGLAEIIENEVSGILVPPRDAQALADAMLRVLADQELADRLGENARKRVREKFSFEKMIEGWIECYETVLAK